MNVLLFLDIVVRKCAAVLKLLPSKNQALLVKRNALLILNLSAFAFTGTSSIAFQGDGLASQGLDKDPHSTVKTKNKVESGFFLNDIIGKSATVLELLVGKDKTLLVRRNAFLNLGFHVVNGIGRLNLDLSSQSLDEYLHTATKMEDEMKSRNLLDVVAGENTTILELLSSEDEMLLIRGEAFFVLNFGLQIVDRIRGLHIQGARFASKGLSKDLHHGGGGQDEEVRHETGRWEIM